MFKRYFCIIYATLLMVFRLATVPFAIVKNFILLRRHRRAYKNQLRYGNERFTSDDSYLAALRARMGKDIASSLGCHDCSGVSSHFVW